MYQYVLYICMFYIWFNFGKMYVIIFKILADTHRYRVGHIIIAPPSPPPQKKMQGPWHGN